MNPTLGPTPTRVLLGLIGTFIFWMCVSSSAHASPELVVAEFDGERVVLVDPVSGTSRVIAEDGHLRRLVGVAVNRDRRIFVSSFDNDAIVSMDTTGTQSLLTSGIGIANPDGVTLSLGGEFLYVADLIVGIIEVDTQTGSQRLVASGSGMNGVGWISTGLDGFLYGTAPLNRDAVLRIDPQSGAFGVISERGFLEDPQGIATDEVGQLYVVCISSNNLVRVNPTTGQQTLISEGNLLENAFGVAAPEGDFIYVTRLGENEIVKVNKFSGEQTIVPGTDLVQPYGLAPLVNRLGEDVPLPPDVTGCSASDDLALRVEITWDDVEGESGYRLYRDGLPIASLNPGVTSYTDFAIQGTYTYCVAAFTIEESMHCCDEGTQRALIAEPRMEFVKDVHADNGGKVVVAWLPSDLEYSPEEPVTQYRIWRRVDPTLVNGDVFPSGKSGPSRRPLESIRSDWRVGTDGLTYWEPIATVPAGNREGYGYTAKTLRDSLPGDNPFTAFFVSGLTSDRSVFYDSAIDSGYSVDNLAPSAPTGLSGEFNAESGVALHWDRNEDRDFLEYAIYAGSSAEFIPSENNRIGATSEPMFLDSTEPLGHYKVSALDVHFNESGFVSIATEDLLDPGSTRGAQFRTTAFLPVQPHPIVETGIFSYVLGSDVSRGIGTRVSLSLYDSRGRRVRTLVDEQQQVGEYRLEWHGRDDAGRRVPVGIYFVRFRAGAFESRASVVVVK